MAGLGKLEVTAVPSMTTPATPDLAEVIVRVLAPYLGPNMARAIARAECDKLGIGGASVSDAQAASLASSLRPGLHVFVGRDHTERILRELSTALRGDAAPERQD
jgi:hypothetical protein